MKEITFLRVTKPSSVGLTDVCALIRNAPQGEIPFSAKRFRNWARRSIRDHNVLCILSRVNKEPAGFFVAFGPWELTDYAWVQEAYIAPAFRGGPLLRRGMELARAWARASGATGLSFQTIRPRAWMNLFAIKAKRTCVEVEV